MIKNLLLEDLGNLKAVSPRILKNYVLNSYGYKNKMGKNSEVYILRGDGSVIYNEFLKLTSTNKKFLFIFRYGQEDLFILKDDYSYNSYVELRITTLEDYEYIKRESPNDVHLDTYRKMKSESGVKKFYNDVVKFLMECTNKPKKDIQEKINYQIILEDETRSDKQKERNSARDYNYDLVINGKHVLSNNLMNKDNLRYRLKQYIESKLPSFNNINDIPKDVSMFENIKKFKLLGEIYELSTTYNLRTNIVDLFNGHTVYIVYRIDSRYRNIINYPYELYFGIRLNNDKLVVDKIMGGSGRYRDNEPKPLEYWSFEKEE